MIHSFIFQSGWTSLHIAASVGNEPILSALLLRGAAVDARNNNDQTPLHYAASRNRVEAAKALLARGAEPDAVDVYYASPLHRAASKGNSKVVQLLIAHHANLNLQDSEGNTPLWVSLTIPCAAVCAIKMMMGMVLHAFVRESEWCKHRLRISVFVNCSVS